MSTSSSSSSSISSTGMSFSASDRSTWSRDEADFRLDLNALTVDGWTAEQRKALLFVLACCMPTTHNRARAAASRAARGKPLPAIQSTASDGGPWEEDYLAGIATLLKLDHDAVEA